MLRAPSSAALRSASSRRSAPPTSQCRSRTLSPSWCSSCSSSSGRKASSASAWRKRRKMSRSVIGQVVYALAAAALVALAATTKTDGYVANILMQAATYTIAVFGLSIVLGLCGQINLAQAAFFALGAYSVALGTVDYHIPFWLCLLGGMAIALAAGAGLGLMT